MKFSLTILAIFALTALAIYMAPVEVGDAMGIAALIESLM